MQAEGFSQLGSSSQPVETPATKRRQTPSGAGSLGMEGAEGSVGIEGAAGSLGNEGAVGSVGKEGAVKLAVVLLAGTGGSCFSSSSCP